MRRQWPGRCVRMSVRGQSRHFGRGLITTGLPPTPDISLHRSEMTRCAKSGIELLLRPHRSNRENWIGSRGRTKEDTGAPVT